jgi:hypothetical protein
VNPIVAVVVVVDETDKLVGAPASVVTDKPVDDGPDPTAFTALRYRVYATLDESPLTTTGEIASAGLKAVHVEPFVEYS